MEAGRGASSWRWMPRERVPLWERAYKDGGRRSDELTAVGAEGRFPVGRGLHAHGGEGHRLGGTQAVEARRVSAWWKKG
jgi:hypothetical protein